jgi:predicted ATPase
VIASRIRPPYNLPAEVTPFVGYESELAYLTERLASNESRLLTIAGPGGSGKTRLALRAAWQEIPNFQGGVYFVNLAAIKPEQLLSAINAVLSLTLQGKAEPKAELYHLLTWLRPKEVLLILDNFEHMINQTELLLRLLHMAPALTILLTSREWTHIRGETVLALRGLACPPAGSVETMEQYSATQLFVQCARRLQPDFRLETVEERQAVTRLCRLVGGMPLALQLAAQWVPVFSLTEITTRVTDNLAFLASPGLHAPQYQRSLMVVFDSSWQRLSHREQGAITRLAVFQGGFSLEAAQAVAQVSPVILLALQSKSLVRPVLAEGERPAGVPGQLQANARRYEVPEPFRRYGADLLQQQSRLAVHIQETNHGRYYLNFLHNQAEKLANPQQRSNALAAIRAELDNIWQAWKWLLNQQLYDKVAQAQYDLVAFFASEGQYQEATRVVNLAVEKLAAVKRLIQLRSYQR